MLIIMMAADSCKHDRKHEQQWSQDMMTIMPGNCDIDGERQWQYHWDMLAMAGEEEAADDNKIRRK